MNSEQKIAIVTGAGSGIGQRAALALLRNGFQVALAGRRVEKLEETAAAAGEFQSQSACIACDVTDPESVQALFQQTHDRFGRIDVLFNNAGINLGGPIEELSIADWRAVVDVNLTGMFLCTQAAFQFMKRQQPKGGRIINNGSISAHVPRHSRLPITRRRAP